MTGVATREAPRRKFWLCIALVFISGLICGCLIGAFGFRHVYLKYSFPKRRVADAIAARLRKDYKLDEETGNKVQNELLALGTEIHIRVRATREDIMNLRREYIDRIGDQLPDDGKRERWRKESHIYLPEPRLIRPLPGDAGQ